MCRVSSLLRQVTPKQFLREGQMLGGFPLLRESFFPFSELSLLVCKQHPQSGYTDLSKGARDLVCF